MGHPARIVLLGGLVIKKQTRRGSLDDRANVRFVRFLIRASRIRGIAIFSRRETKIRWKVELITAFGLVLILRHFRKLRPSILWFPASSTLVQRLVSESRIRRNWSESVFSVCYKYYRLGEFLFRESMIIFIRFLPGLSSMNRYILCPPPPKKKKKKGIQNIVIQISLFLFLKIFNIQRSLRFFLATWLSLKKGAYPPPSNPVEKGSIETKNSSFLSNNRSNDRWTNFGSVGKKVARGVRNAGCQAISVLILWWINSSKPKPTTCRILKS